MVTIGIILLFIIILGYISVIHGIFSLYRAIVYYRRLCKSQDYFNELLVQCCRERWRKNGK